MPTSTRAPTPPTLASISSTALEALWQKAAIYVLKELLFCLPPIEGSVVVSRGARGCNFRIIGKTLSHNGGGRAARTHSSPPKPDTHCNTDPLFIGNAPPPTSSPYLYTPFILAPMNLSFQTSQIVFKVCLWPSLSIIPHSQTWWPSTNSTHNIRPSVCAQCPQSERATRSLHNPYKTSPHSPGSSTSDEWRFWIYNRDMSLACCQSLALTHKMHLLNLCIMGSSFCEKAQKQNPLEYYIMIVFFIGISDPAIPQINNAEWHLSLTKAHRWIDWIRNKL